MTHQVALRNVVEGVCLRLAILTVEEEQRQPAVAAGAIPAVRRSPLTSAAYPQLGPRPYSHSCPGACDDAECTRCVLGRVLPCPRSKSARTPRTPPLPSAGARGAAPPQRRRRRAVAWLRGAAQRHVRRRRVGPLAQAGARARVPPWGRACGTVCPLCLPTADASPQTDTRCTLDRQTLHECVAAALAAAAQAAADGGALELVIATMKAHPAAAGVQEDGCGLLGSICAGDYAPGSQTRWPPMASGHGLR